MTLVVSGIYWLAVAAGIVVAVVMYVLVFAHLIRKIHRLEQLIERRLRGGVEISTK